MGADIARGVSGEAEHRGQVDDLRRLEVGGWRLRSMHVGLEGFLPSLRGI